MSEHGNDDSEMVAMISSSIASFKDFPKPGVIFRDIFSLMKKPALFKKLIDHLVVYVRKNCSDADIIVGLDSRGFLLGPMMSVKLNLPFVPIRKAGKLPGETIGVSYSLEYGLDTLEIQKSSINPGQKVVIVDDLIATGGTMTAAVKLIKDCGAAVSCCIVAIELTELQGFEKLRGESVYSVVKY
ncbi:Aprt (predicted) [Pycnogonum litorale]